MKNKNINSYYIYKVVFLANLEYFEGLFGLIGISIELLLKKTPLLFLFLLE